MIICSGIVGKKKWGGGICTKYKKNIQMYNDDNKNYVNIYLFYALFEERLPVFRTRTLHLLM